MDGKAVERPPYITNRTNQQQAQAEHQERIKPLKPGLLSRIRRIPAWQKLAATVGITVALSQTPAGGDITNKAVNFGEDAIRNTPGLNVAADLGVKTLSTIGEMLDPVDAKDIQDVRPDYILKGPVIVRKGAELRMEPVFPEDANATGHHNLVGIDALGQGDEQHYENLKVVEGFRGGIPELQLVIPSKDGKAVYTPYKPKNLTDNIEMPETNILEDAMVKVKDGRKVYFAKGIDYTEVGKRTGPPVTPAP